MYLFQYSYILLNILLWPMLKMRGIGHAYICIKIFSLTMTIFCLIFAV